MDNNSKIKTAIEKYEKEVHLFLSKLVQVKSVNGRDDEVAVTKIIEEEVTKLGLPYQIVAKDNKRPNIVVGENMTDDRGLMFVAHLDTVPEGDRGKWHHDPFKAEIEDGKMFGRGTIDCKAGAVAAIYTLKILSDLGLETGAKFAGVVDEEGAPDSDLGAAYLLEQGLRAKSAIYTYPNVHAVTIGHRGLVRLWIEIDGEAAHTGTKEWQFRTKGASALEAAARFIIKMNEMVMEGDHKDFPGYKFVHTATLIEGGSGESIVPDKTKLLIDTRLLPNHDPEEYIGKIRKLADELETEKIKFTLKIKNKIPGAVIEREEKIVQLLDNLDKEVMGVKPEIKGCGPVNEGYMFIKAGIPTICGFGPQGEGAHSADEHVNLETLPKIMEMYVRAAIAIGE